MNRRGRGALVLMVLGCILSGSGSARAQSFGLRLERGEIGVDGRGVHHIAGVSPGSFTSDYQQWLRLPISGFAIHPGVLRFAVTVRPLFGQHLASTDGQGTTRTNNIGRDLSATLFQIRRMTLAVQSIRSSGASRGDFGTSSDFQNSAFTTSLFFRDRYFPTTVTYTDRSVRDSWVSPYTAAPIIRDQTSASLRVGINNRRLTTTFEQRRYRDHRGTGDHDASNGQARHRIGWGKGSTLVSSLNLYHRVGTSAIDRKSWSERAVIAHTREVSTALSFSRQTWSRGMQSGRNLSYDATSTYSPAIALVGALSVSGQRFSTGTYGALHRFRVAPSFQYLATLPAGLRLQTSASIGKEHLSRSIPSDVLIDVLEEPHDVDVARSFSLIELRVERESIEIWNEARTLILVEGVDYRIVETGPTTEIQILPGSRVDEGEIVLVTYRYRTLAGEETDLLYLNYESTLRAGGLSLRHGRRQRSENTSGAGGALPSPSDVDLWFGASYSGRTRFGGISLDAARRSRSAEEIRYSTNEARLDYTPPAFGRVEGRLRATTAKTVAEDQVTSTSTAGGSMAWPVSRTLRVTAGVDAWIWGRDGQDDERFLSGHAMATWRFGQVNTIFTFDQVRRSNGIGRAENRWSVRVVRRF